MVACEVRNPHDLSGVGPGRGDSLSIVEAAYDLHSPDSVWLANLVQAFEPVLGPGCGAYGFFYEFSPDRTSIRVDSPVLLNCPPGFLEALGQATLQVAPEELDWVFNGQPCTSMSQILGRTGHRAYATFRPAQALRATTGVQDQLIVGARSSNVEGCSFAVALDRVAAPSVRTASLMARVARHIAVARRLRSSLSQMELQAGTVEVDAIFAERGALLHAEGSAKQKDQRTALARAVQRLVDGRNRLQKRDPDEAVRLWNALVDGRWSLVDSVDSDGKRFLIARKNTPELGDPVALSPDERHLAALFAFGHSTKLVAYELGLSPSTVSARFATVLRKLKVDSRAEFARLFGGRQ